MSPRPSTFSALFSGDRIWAFLLGLSTVAVFLPCVGNGFVNYDDPTYLLQNSHIQSGSLPGIVNWAFTSGYAANWHPLTWLSHALDWRFFGANPAGHHAINIALHALATVSCFLALRRLTVTLWPSLIVAAIFGLHPLRVESVAWASERKDTLSALFWMLTLWAYARFATASAASNRRGWYGAALGFFALGLLSKPMAVTLPCVLLLLDYWPLKRSRTVLNRTCTASRLILEKIPFILLSAASCLITWLVQKSGGAIHSDEPSFSLAARLANAPLAYWRYIAKFIFPTGLAVFYPFPASFNPWAIAAAVVGLLGLTLLALLQWHRRPYLLVGWLWFLGTTVPVLGIIQVGSQSIADRYNYIPEVGLALIVVWFGAEMVAAWRLHPVIPAVVSCSSIALCAALSIHQLAFWKDSETLFRHAIEVTGPNPIAELNLGCAFIDTGDHQQAIVHLKRSLDISGINPIAHLDLGEEYFKTNAFDLAIPELNIASADAKLAPMAHYTLGLCYIGKADWMRAGEELRFATQLDPTFPESHIELGIVVGRLGRTDLAIKEYQTALRLDPQNSDALNNLAVAFARTGHWSDAAVELQKVVALNPANPEFHNNLGLAYENLSRPDDAINQYEEAVRLAPDFTQARQNLQACLSNRAAGKQPPPVQ